MVAFSKICFAASAAVSVMAAPSAGKHGPLVKFGELKSMPLHWSTHGQADRNAMVTAQIALKQNNIKGLQEKLLDVANPHSPNYGKWLSKEEVDKFTAPAEEHVSAVKAWLASNGIKDVSHSQNDWLEFTAPIHQLETLLDAKYEWFSHGPSGLKVPRTAQYSVPKGLHDAIDTITPTTALYADLSAHAHENTSKRAASDDITPQHINSLYNVDYTSSGSQLIATTGFIGVSASHDDFSTFAQQYVSGLQDFKDVGVNGGSNSGNPDGEGNLDTQYAGGVSYPNPSEYLANAPESGENQKFNDAMYALTQYLQTTDSPPSVVSTSYGGEERYQDASYITRICNEFAKVGSRGISVFFSSGDNGVAGNGETSCSDGFYGTWPAACPYITSIGGTEFDDNGDEVVANFQQYNDHARSPGGGYSEVFAAPDYNRNVTTAYAQSLSSDYQQKFNSSNRGYPDLALASVKYEVIIGGQTKSILGTSASSPATAALFSVLNDYRHSQGKPALGFLNPLLYSGKVDAALRDITSGSNFACDSDGFPAQSGWDAASGLGSIDFAKFRSLI